MVGELKYFEEINRLNDIFSEIDAVYHAIAQRQGLSDSAMNILYCVAQLGEGCPLSQVYKRNGGSRQTVGSALRRLEEQGVLFLRAADGKSKTIWLTEKGRQLLAEKVMPVIEMENDIYMGWPEAEVQEHLRRNALFLRQLKEKFQQTCAGE